MQIASRRYINPPKNCVGYLSPCPEYLLVRSKIASNFPIMATRYIPDNYDHHGNSRYYPYSYRTEGSKLVFTGMVSFYGQQRADDIAIEKSANIFLIDGSHSVGAFISLRLHLDPNCRALDPQTETCNGNTANTGETSSPILLDEAFGGPPELENRNDSQVKLPEVSEETPEVRNAPPANPTQTQPPISYQTSGRPWQCHTKHWITKQTLIGAVKATREEAFDDLKEQCLDPRNGHSSVCNPIICRRL